jgi:5-methylcytosine-specific restriction endonuclease McrA
MSLRTGKNHPMYGKKSPNYIDGRTTLTILIRCSSRNKWWIRDGLKVNHFTCQKCNQYGGDLNFHHKKSFNLIFSENHIQSLEDAYNCPEFWDLNNGITFCKDCHNEFHKIYGYKNTTKEQTEEFLK